MEEEAAIIATFRRLIDVDLQEFINASQQLGEPIFGLANMVKRAFRNLLSFIIDGVFMERPDDARYTRMTDLLSSEITDIQLFRDRNRQVQEVFNHLSTVSESIVALSWINVSNTPVPFIHDMRDAGQYFGNRVLSQYKGKQQHQDWINKWNKVLAALEKYVKDYHRTGFSWNVARIEREHGRPTAAGDAGVQSQIPPPPPPPPPMDLTPEGGDTRQNLLKDLNRGVDIVRTLRARCMTPGSSSAEDGTNSPDFSSDYSPRSVIGFSGAPRSASSSAEDQSLSPGYSTDSPDITLIGPEKWNPRRLMSPDCGTDSSSSDSLIISGAFVSDFSRKINMLKPVTKEQLAQSQGSMPSTSGENLPRKPVAERTYPPKFLLDGRKWRVEHQKDRYDLVIDSAEMSHSLAMFKCQNSGLAVRNKLNGVTIDNCKRTTVVLMDIISSVELIGCQHVKLYCAGHVPLVSIDNCDSVEIYLSEMSLDTEMISSKSSSLNVNVKTDPNADYVEMAVPEQIKTVVVNGKLVSTVVEKI